MSESVRTALNLYIRKFYKEHPEKYPLLVFPGVLCLFSCRDSTVCLFLKTDARGRAECRYGCFSLTLYYSPQPGTEMQWFDEEFRFRDSFIDEWKAYCAGKESSRHLKVEDYALFALFKEKELMDVTEVTAAMDQLEYLPDFVTFLSPKTTISDFQ